nr:aminoglycoside phosphotransferase family protein [Actinomadura barringtoniae]
MTKSPALRLPNGAPPSRSTLRWVEQCLGQGASVKMVRPLAGGVAHVNHAVLAESRSGSAHRLVLRRWLPAHLTAPAAPADPAPNVASSPNVASTTDLAAGPDLASTTDLASASGSASRMPASRVPAIGGPTLSVSPGFSAGMMASGRGGAEFSPEREIAALALLAGCELPTPSLVAADPGGAYADAPALLITRLIGHPPRPAPEDLPEYLIQLAAALLSVHALNGASTMPPYNPYNRLGVRLPPKHALRPEVWESAFDVAARPAPEAPSRFIHRDYHPDNTLWSYGRLTGVVDWSDASYGPVAVDIAQMRLSLVLRYGQAAADRFLAAFDQVSGGYRHDPFWDIRAVLDLLPEDSHRVLDEAQIPLFEEHLATQLAELGAPTP